MEETENRSAKKNIHSFGDFAKEKFLNGPKVDLKSILNKRILVKAYRVTESKFKDKGSQNLLTVQFEDDEGNTCVFFTGSDILRTQLDKYDDQLPFYATVIQSGRCFTFT